MLRCGACLWLEAGRYDQLAAVLRELGHLSTARAARPFIVQASVAMETGQACRGIRAYRRAGALLIGP